MVKVIGLSKDEVERRERASKLVEITKEVLGSEAKIDDSPYSFFSVYPNPKIKSPIYVIPNDNFIIINDPKLLDYALGLANSYERTGEPEFTVKKDYD